MKKSCIAAGSQVALVVLFCGLLVACGTRGETVSATDLDLSVASESPHSISLQSRKSAHEWIMPTARIFRIGDAREIRSKLVVRRRSALEIECTLQVTNIGSAAQSVSVTFPNIEHLRNEPAEDGWSYCFPRLGAEIGVRPCTLRAPYSGQFPLQFMDVWNSQKGGLYVIAADQSNSDKTFWLTKTSSELSMGVDHRPRLLKPSATWELPPCIIGVHDGDWHAGLQAYKDWLASWYLPRAARKKWFQEIVSFRQAFLHPNLGLDYGAFDSTKGTMRLEEMIQEDGTAFGGVDYVHLFDWSKTPDQGRVGAYEPWRYLGGKKTLTQPIASLQKQDVQVGAYFEGYLLSKKASVLADRLKSGEMTNGKGGPYLNFGGNYLYMCPQNHDWQQHLVQSVASATTALSLNGAYLDQLGFGYQYPCYNANHGHAVPSSQINGELVLIAACRDTLPPSVALYTEATPTDVTTQYLDGSFTHNILHGRRNRSLPFALNLTRFALPDFKVFEIIHADAPIGNDLNGIRQTFFNGEGIWLAGASQKEPWFSSDAKLLIRKVQRIMHAHQGAFFGQDPAPLVPTASAGGYANAFRDDGETVWTLYNANPSISHVDLVVDGTAEFSYVNLWDQRKLERIEVTGKTVIRVPVAVGEVGCIVSRGSVP